MTPFMDSTLSSLRVQSEYVCELATAVCTTVKQIEHRLSKEDTTPTNTNVLLAQLVGERQQLFTETRNLYERLQGFIETASSIVVKN